MKLCELWPHLSLGCDVVVRSFAQGVVWEGLVGRDCPEEIADRKVHVLDANLFELEIVVKCIECGVCKAEAGGCV